MRPPTTPSPGRAAYSSLEPPPRWPGAQPRAGLSLADVHVHTTFSDGVARPEEVLNHYVLRTGARVIAITDHDTLDGALWARDFMARHPEAYSRLQLIVGEEVSTADGHVLGLFLERRIPPGMSAAETVAAIHEQGGLAVAAHPYTCWMRWAGLVGVGDLIRELPFDAVETRNSNFTEVFANRRAERSAGAKARIGASDGHFLAASARCATLFAGTTAEDLRRSIQAAETVPTGSSYGLLTLLAYVGSRLRVGASVWPAIRSPARPAAKQDALVAERASDGLALVSVAGALGERAGEALLPLVSARLEAGEPVLLDLARVTAAEDTGVTVLLECLALAARLTGRLACVRPSPAASRALRSSGLDSILPVLATLDAGAKWLEGRGGVESLSWLLFEPGGAVLPAQMESGACP